MCFMSTMAIWKKLGTLDLTPSSITLWAYDSHLSHPKEIIQNVPIDLGGKMVFIDFEVVDTQLDYNILLGHSYSMPPRYFEL